MVGRKMTEINSDKLGKIVALAKRGVGGEQTAAIEMLKRLCNKYNLNFDDVMSQATFVDGELYYKKDTWKKIAIQCVCRYGLLKSEDSVRENKFRKKIFFKTTPALLIETLNAFDVLSRAYDQERRKMNKLIFTAFLQKHDLFYQLKEGEKYKESSKSMSLAEMLAAAAMAEGMQDVEIRKRLK